MKMAVPEINRKWFLALPFFLFVLSFFISPGLYAQDTTGLIPDGTQGEQLEVLKTDSSKLRWRDKRWRLFNGRISTFKMGAGFLYEYAGYAADDNSKKQMDSLGTPLEGQFKVRDFRLIFSGQFKTKRTISWKAGLMYDAPSGDWFVRETGFTIHVPEIESIFFVGRTKEGFSMNKVMNGYAGWTFERQMALDVIPILADGIKWMAYLPDKRIFWNVGMFTNWLSKNQSFSTYKWQFISRVGWLPVYNKTKDQVLHLGLNYRYGKVEDGVMQLRSRPEANPAPYFISTGKFSSDHSNQMGYEAYYKKGRLMVGSEYYWHMFSSDPAGDPTYKGGEIGLTYLFVGSSRPYNTTTSIFGFVPVEKSILKGGWGTIEGVLRFSVLDLNSGNINGGKFWRITPMLNWYLTREVRLELGYGYGKLDRFNLKGGTHFFQSRLQIAFL
ncbi:MAG TPA: porin [Chitinophagaceae bacterium]|nr:porin [Chitinophagaceae bacterium]